MGRRKTSEPIPPATEQEIAIEMRIKMNLKRTRNLFASNDEQILVDNPASQKVRLSTKILQEYSSIPVIPTDTKESADASVAFAPASAIDDGTMAVDKDLLAADAPPSATGSIIHDIKKRDDMAPQKSEAIVAFQKAQSAAASFGSAALIRRHPNQVPQPQWHAPWKLKRVISGHLGWVRAIAVDPTNDWFATGAADRSIKIWDLASGQLKLTLTGHINCIRGLAVSPRHPYLFSAAEDKKVLCWDLEYNKVIRSYHGHLSGVYCMKLHPTLDVLITGGRDSVARVWDMRTKQQIHCLSGHHNTIWSLETQSTDPQVITGSMDCTVKLWDLAAGKVMTTLTNHKKAVRALVTHPKEYSFMSGAADNLKKWHAKDGRFLRNFSGHNAIVNSMAVNQDNVLVSCGDNGSMNFWDYKTGYCFQKHATVAQPGSLDSEVGIYASCFDMSGLRLITGEADKTVKIWQEDENASEASHPVDMKQWTKEYTAPKRF